RTDGALNGSYLAPGPDSDDGGVEETGLDRTICEEDQPPEELSRTVVGEESGHPTLLSSQQTRGADGAVNPTSNRQDNPVQAQMSQQNSNPGVKSAEFGDNVTTHLSYAHHHRTAQERDSELACQSLEPTGVSSGFLSEIDEKSQRSQCQSLYVWTTTHASRNACPPSWTHPLKLVQNAKSRQEHHNQHPSEVSERPKTTAPVEKQLSPLPAPLPVTCPFQHLHKWDAEKTLDVSDAAGSLEFQHGMLKVVISEGIVYRFVTVAKIHIVEIHPGDGSIIVSQGVKGHFYTHYITVEDRLEERTYSLKSLPAGHRKGRYSIAKLIQTANRYLMMNQQWERRGLKQELPCWKREMVAVVEPLSSSLLEECVVEGLGKFTAFTNGRVRAVFEDRTALDMVCNFSKRASESLQHGQEPKASLPVASQVSLPVSSYEAIFGASTARLLLPSGQYVTVDIQSPGQYKSYIQAGREWASWVNSSPMERHQFYTQKHAPSAMLRAAEHELKKIFCFNYILEQTMQMQNSIGYSSLDHALESDHRPTASVVPSPAALPAECEYSEAGPGRFAHLSNQTSPPYTHRHTRSQHYQQQSVQDPDTVFWHSAPGNDAHFNSRSGSNMMPEFLHVNPKGIRTSHQTAVRPGSQSGVMSVSDQMTQQTERMQSVTDGFQAVRQVLLRNSNLINDIDEFLDNSRKGNLLHSAREQDH
ncbi:hypothetical protein EGW08_016706, partial [Elysia chlorotica]